MNRISSDIPGGNRAILYIPKLREKIGDITATILMYQLERHFIIKPDGFSRFLSPTPKFIHYKPGDSWTEELGFSAQEFKKVFQKIGLWFPNQSQYEKAKAEGFDFNSDRCYYCSYIDWNTGLIHTFRNHEKVNALIESMAGGAE